MIAIRDAVQPEALQAGHQPEQTSFKTLFGLGIGLIAALVVVHASVVGVMLLFNAVTARGPARALAQPQLAPGAPSNIDDIRAIRLTLEAQQRARLNNQRMPIDRAMQEIAAHGLPQFGGSSHSANESAAGTQATPQPQDQPAEEGRSNP